MAPGVVEQTSLLASQDTGGDTNAGLKPKRYAKQTVTNGTQLNSNPLASAYELEEHPIDVVRPVRVSQRRYRNPEYAADQFAAGCSHRRWYFGTQCWRAPPSQGARSAVDHI